MGRRSTGVLALAGANDLRERKKSDLAETVPRLSVVGCIVDRDHVLILIVLLPEWSARKYG
jgi:hypothetical protein